MGVYIEALILFIVLFFSSFAASGAFQAVAAFSSPSEVLKIIHYSIPSIAIILYILVKSRKAEPLVLKPGKKDLISCLIAFPCLLITGIAISAISMITVPITQPQSTSPTNAAGWIMLGLFCLIFAYMEESFFRFYLLSKRKEMNLSAPSALAVSAILFSICHIYLGPLGFINSAIAGLILGYMFLKWGSLHGIAIAHALYNITAYVIYSVLN